MFGQLRLSRVFLFYSKDAQRLFSISDPVLQSPNRGPMFLQLSGHAQEGARPTQQASSTSGNLENILYFRHDVSLFATGRLVFSFGGQAAQDIHGLGQKPFDLLLRSFVRAG